MNKNEREYKRTTSVIGTGLIIFLVIINVSSVIPSIVEVVAQDLIEDYAIRKSLKEIISMILYLSMFLFPALIIKIKLKKENLYERVRFEFKITKSSLLLMVAGIGIARAMAYLTQFFLLPQSLFPVFDDEFINSVQKTEPFEAVLLIVSIAIIPAICEEILFRGIILTNLLPYGKDVAIIGSAVLFGLMHGNPMQILFTTVVGLFMGYAYVKTKSIWPGTIMHFANNLIAVLFQIYQSNNFGEISFAVVVVIETAIFTVGVICFVLYAVLEGKKKKARLKDGAFGKEIEESEKYSSKPVSSKLKLKYFFTPTMIVFSVLSVASFGIFFLALKTLQL